MPLLPAKEMADRRSSREVSRKHLEKARSPSPVMGVRGEMLQKRREKVDAGSIPQNHNVKEKTCPPDQLRGLTQDIQRPVKTEARLAGVKKHKTEAHIAGEKKHTEGNASFPTKRTTPLLKARTEGLILQKHNAKEKTCPRDQLRGHTQGIKRPVKTESPPLAGEMSQKRTDKADTVSTPQKHSAKEKTRPPDQLRGHTQGIHRPVKTEARMSQKRREKVDTGSIPQKHNAMEKTRPPDQLRRHTQGIQRPVKTEARLAGEKKHTKVNTSFPTKRTTPQLRTRTSSRCSNACTSRPMDAHGHGNTAAIQEQREESAAVKVDEDVAEIIQKLNKLGLGEDISFEEYYGYLEKLPLDPRVDTSNKVDLIGRFRMDLRHAVYRIRSYKLLKNESKNELCRLELKECPMDLLDKDEFPNDFLVKMQYFSFFQKKGVLDWFFDPDLPAGLNDYQRLVPHDHGNWEYASWCAYRSYFHSYEMQHEYIKYFETLLGELEWLKDCLPRKFSSLTINKIRTRGIYQATKIATRFSNITPHLARIGFDDCFTYMTIEATWCNRSDDLYFEIWKRVTQQKKSFRDALKEVYELNKCPSLQESMKYAIEDDCSVMKRAFLRCTAGAGITKEVPVDKAQELIAEAVKNLSIQPKFYDGYIRKKIEIAKPIGLITVD